MPNVDALILARLGKDMRKKQDDYFAEKRAAALSRNRHAGNREGAVSNALVLAKAAERAFDRACDEVLGNATPSLFGDAS